MSEFIRVSISFRENNKQQMELYNYLLEEIDNRDTTISKLIRDLLQKEMETKTQEVQYEGREKENKQTKILKFK